jgi:glycerophosphoryl diester phosphodiesterase
MGIRVVALAAAMGMGGGLGVGVGSPAGAAPVPPPVTVYAHRGGAGLAPENTLGAFRQTHAQFGDRGVWLEMDTQLSADGHLVVLHDDTLERTTNCAGPVGHVPLAVLATCDASESFPGWGAFEPVPALRDVLIEGRDAGWRLMVEIKNVPGESNFDLLGTKVADALVALVRETGFPLHRILVQSFWPLSLDRMEARLPGVGTVFLTSSSLPALPGIGIPVLVNALYGWLRRYEVTAPASDSLDMNATIVTVARLLGRRVVPYTPNTHAAIQRVLNMGVDGVISDYPDRVYELLG